MDLYSTFMRAAAKAIMTNIPGEAEEVQDNKADETSWKIFTLKNNHLSKIIQDVHNTGLGSLYLIRLSIIAPLSIENKLPGVGAVFNLALRRSKQHEQSQKWRQAGDELIWLFRLASRTFHKQCDVVAKATANLMEYLRLINWIYKRKTPCDSDSFTSFGIDTRELRKLHSNVQRELENADSTLHKLLWKKYKVLGPIQARWHTHAHDEAETLLVKGESTRTDSRDVLHRTATHYAGISRNMDAFEKYLASQYEVNAQDLCGRTALHYTSFCKDGKPEVVEGLVRHGAELDIRARDGAAPLHYAAMTRKKDVVEALVRAGATIDILDLSGGSPLHTAAFHGHLEVVRYLWERAKRDLRDRSGWTVLHLAAIAGKEEVVDFLLNENVDQMAKDREWRTAFHLAAMAGKESVFLSLLEKGVDIEAKDRQGMTALHLACKVGNLAVVTYLIDKEANIEAKTPTYMRPLGIACANGHEEIVQSLMQAGADRKWTNGRGEGLLHLAARGPNHDLTRALLDDGHDVDSYAYMRVRPLHCAAAHDRRLNGELLIAAEADLEQPDNDGETPLWYAVVNGRTDFVKLLLDNEASVHVRCNDRAGVPSTTMLSMAKERGNKTTIDLLEEHALRHPLAASDASPTTETSHASLHASSQSDTASQAGSVHSSEGPSPDIAG